MLLADTGAGSMRSGFEVVLTESDCLTFGRQMSRPVLLRGAYSGTFPVYWVHITIPALEFDHRIRAAAVPSHPPDLDGIASFRFLNRFAYGNFGSPSHFGLEMVNPAAE